MPKESERCPTVLLSDEPTVEDAFGHARIAESIADLITGEAGGKCIGLVGPWGSGKSSVVEILKGRLHSASEKLFGVFVFDAWAHQGDPLRRTFLEQLIRFLEDNEWLAEEQDWAREKKEELSKRFQSTRVKKEPILTPLGGVFALLVLLLPLGFRLSAGFTNEPRWAEWIGIALTSAPFLFVAAVWACWRPNWKFWQKGFWLAHRPPHDKRSLSAFIVRNSRELQFSDTIRTPDPTSVEFQSIFAQGLRKSLQDRKRRLLIVIDNLDRVDVGDALAIWSTMRTFFDFDARACKNWLSRLWLLVPFDEGSVEALWSKQPVRNFAERLSDSASQGKESNASDLAKSFTDKTFQITFRVARPVLSNWHSFLVDQLGSAFPTHKGTEEFHWIYRIFDRRVVEETGAPTPREVKLFVNSVGALHRQWQDTIPLHVQAFYAILSKQVRDLSSDLAGAEDQNILGNIPAAMLGEDWRVWLAAIHFNVPIDEALQVSMGSRLQAALSSGKHDELKTLSEIRGFDHVLEKIAERARSIWAEREAGSLAVAAATLSQIHESKNPSRTRAWNLMCDVAGNTERWPGFSDEAAKGIIELAKRRPSPSFVRKLVTAAKESLRVDDGSPSPAQIGTWLKGALVLIAGLSTTHEKDLREALGVVGSAGTYLDVVAAANESPEGRTACAFLPPECAPEEVVNSLGETIGKGEFSKPDKGVALLLEQLHPDWSWGEFAEGPLRERLRANAQLEISELEPLLSLLTDLSTRYDEADSTLLSLAKEGFIAYHLSYASPDAKVAALCLLPLLRVQAEGGALSQSTPQCVVGMQKFAQATKSPAEDTVEAFLDLVVKLGSAEFLFSIPKRAPNSTPFAHAVLRRIAERPDGYKWISPERIIEERQMLGEACGDEIFSRLVRESAEQGSLIEVMTQSDFDLELAPLYAAGLDAQSAKPTLANYLVKGLQQISKEDWSEELSNEGEVLTLLFSLLDAGVKPRLAVAFEDALVDHAQALAKGEVKVERLGEDWTRLIASLDEDHMRATLRRILLVVCDSPNPTDDILQIYGKELQGSPAVLEQREKVILDLARNFFERLRPVEMRWLRDVVERVPDLLSSASKTAQKEFRARLRAASKEENSEGEAAEALERLSELAGTKRESKEKKDESDEPKEG